MLWASLSFLVLILALKGKTPDIEWTPFSDQSSHLMATMSLWHDLDLRYTLDDLERFNVRFPAADGPRGTFLKQSPNGELHFAKPALYATLNAPFYGVFGTFGFTIFNLLAIATMAALTQHIALRIYGGSLSHLMTASLFLLGPFMAWTTIVHPDIFIALLLYTGGYLALTRNSSVGSWVAGLLLGMALSEKPTFAAALPFLLLAVPGVSLRKHGWIVFGVLVGWFIPTAINLGQDGNLLAYQGIRFDVQQQPFPLEAGWTSPGIETTGHIFDAGLLLHALADNLTLAPSIVFDFFFGRQTGLLLYFPVALVFLSTVLTRRNTKALLIFGGLIAYLSLNALAFPSNGFGGTGSYGSRYLMQALPLLMLALLPIGQIASPGHHLVPRQYLAIVAVIASLAFQHVALPPSRELVQNPTKFLLAFPATLFPLEERLLPSIPIHASHFRTNNDSATTSLFSRNISSDRIKKYVNGIAESQVTLYQHDVKQALPVLNIHSTVSARVEIKNREGQIWMGSISPHQAQLVPLDDSFFQHKAFDLLDKKTKRWGSFSITMLSDSVQDKPAYASFDLITRLQPKSISLNRDIRVHQFQEQGIVPRFSWSHIENWGRWTDGEYAELQISLPDNLSSPTEIRTLVRAFVPNKNIHQTVEVFLNGKKQIDRTFTSSAPAMLTVPIDPSTSGTEITLGFLIRNPTSPFELGISQDFRALGLGLISLHLATTSNI